MLATEASVAQSLRFVATREAAHATHDRETSMRADLKSNHASHTIPNDSMDVARIFGEATVLRAQIKAAKKTMNSRF